ncbi:hypothetical protein SDC9_136298 [bioreactor metagenome]|uniref:Uncharacterized protein n=1 Tax=bioreactor metagenome TaxID=1076179 RepID=A0A645DI81_9ZZZZ
MISLRLARFHEFNTRFDCLQRLLPAHRRAEGHIRRAVGDVLINQVRRAFATEHAHINRDAVRARLLCHDADGGALVRDKPCHHRRNLRRRGGDALRRNPVIRAEHKHRAPVNPRLRACLHPREGNHRALQQPKAADGLGEVVPARRRLLCRRTIKGGDLLPQLFEVCHGFSSRHWDRSPRIHAETSIA